MPTDRQTGTHGVDTAAKRGRLDQMPNDVADADHADLLSWIVSLSRRYANGLPAPLNWHLEN
jgi:hypothetical protein